MFCKETILRLAIRLIVGLFLLYLKSEGGVKMQEMIKIVKEALQNPHANVEYIGVAGGMTNKNYLIDVDGDRMIMRMPGNGTSSLIDRRTEYDNLTLGSKLGINPPVCYFNMENGMKLTREVPNSKPLTKLSTLDEALYEKVARIFKCLHQASDKMPHAFRLFELMQSYEELAIAANANFYKEFDQVKAYIALLQARFTDMPVTYAPCHIDPARSNILLNHEGTVYLIDWEYGGMFDPLWDIAAFSLEADLRPDEESIFFQYYFEKGMTEEEQERILLHKIFQDYLWSIWTLFKEEQGDEFGLYGHRRFSRAKEQIRLYEAIYQTKYTAQ